MRLLWESHPRYAQDIIAGLDHRDWHPRTVKTMLARLTAKGVVSTTSQGRAYLYSPAVSQDDCLKAESQTLLERVSDAAPALLANLVDNAELSADDIDRLRAILDRKEEQR